MPILVPDHMGGCCKHNPHPAPAPSHHSPNPNDALNNAKKTHRKQDRPDSRRKKKNQSLY